MSFIVSDADASARESALKSANRQQLNRGQPRTPCFVAGSSVATIKGSVPIEDLRVGDLVLTRDGGYQPIRWIGAREFDSASLADFPELQPVRVKHTAFGSEEAEASLRVSPQHRILVSDAVVGAGVGDKEMLVAAIDLVAIGLAEVENVATIVYYHIMFDTHAIVLADGCWSESFLPEAAALDGLHDAQLREILTIFPELAGSAGQSAYRPARAITVPAQREMQSIAA